MLKSIADNKKNIASLANVSEYTTSFAAEIILYYPRGNCCYTKSRHE